MSELCDYSIRELQKAYQARRVTPSEVVESYISSIEKENAHLNALVADCFDRAREKAKALDKQLRDPNYELPPVFGLPFTSKEMIQVAELPHTLGLVKRKGRKSEGTATVILRLEEKGGIFLGVSNIPELGLWIESHNEIYGRTKNPIDPTRTAGGSSGGEAALVAAHGSSFGVGSDVGGSIRMPAFFCGLAGHKPSNRMVPMTGHFPVPVDKPETKMGPCYPLTVIGPICREARDLRPLMLAMSGRDGRDTEISEDSRIKKSLKRLPQDWKKIKIFTMESPFIPLVTPTDRELAKCVKQAADMFESRGCEVEEFPRHLFFRSFEMWSAALGHVQGASLTRSVADGGEEARILTEFISLAKGTPNHTLPVLMFLTLEKLFKSDKRIQKLFKELLVFRQKIYERIGTDGILLLPPHPRVAPKHNSPLFRPFDFLYTGVFNALEMPATVVPMGRSSKSGLPLGVQIATLPYEDGLALSAAELIESEMTK
ncbi:MAG: amidase [Pseudobdellovibrionaceae bacterium]